MNLPQGQMTASIPHDIYGLASYEKATPLWLWILVAVLLVAALLGLYFWYLKKRKAAPSSEQEKDPLAEIRSEVDRLSPREPFTGRAPVEFYFSLSISLRRFIELRYKNIPATDMTTKELESKLYNRLPLARERIAAMISFLKHADMVKFADVSVALDEAQKDHTLVKEWLSYMMPQESDLVFDGGDDPKNTIELSPFSATKETRV